MSAQRNLWKTSWFSTILFLSAVSVSGCSAEPVPMGWRHDCVGRMQIALPEVADVATVTFGSIKESDESARDPRFLFSDGQRAPYSRTDYFGPVLLTGPLSQQDYEAIEARIAEERTLYQTGKSNGEVLNRPRPIPLETAPFRGGAWNFGDSVEARLLLGNHYLSWGVSMQASNLPLMLSLFTNLKSGLQSRANFELPSQTGVCMPYAFVRDDGTIKRAIATTYRLKSQPDVTVMLEDARSTISGQAGSDEQLSAIYRSNFFWTQRYQSYKKIKSLLSGFHNKVPFAGQRGVETMFILTRDDGTEDFGYMIATRGDPDAKEDVPDLMFYVIRDAENAKRKGKRPMDKAAFFKLAKTIASSVKHRPTK